jgi:hypothetical protein
MEWRYLWIVGLMCSKVGYVSCVQRWDIGLIELNFDFFNLLNIMQ